MVPTRKNEQQERLVTTLNTPCCAIRTNRALDTTETTNAEHRVLLHVHAKTEGASLTCRVEREENGVQAGKTNNGKSLLPSDGGGKG